MTASFRSSPPQPAASAGAPATPWWRYPMVWLVIGGPAVVVVASFVTLALALKYPDPVLDSGPPAAGAADGRAASLVPALQGRNQAAAVAVRPSADTGADAGAVATRP